MSLHSRDVVGHAAHAAGPLAAPARSARHSRSLRSAAAAETRRVIAVVVERWRVEGVRGFAVTIVACTLIAAVTVLSHQRFAGNAISACCGERDGLPLPRWLARLPGSAFAPAHDLPVWGALAQMLAAAAIAEAVAGSRLTIAVAAAGHLLSSAAARVMVTVASGSLLGLPLAQGRVLDAGPSAATVALTAYVAFTLRCRVLGAVAAAAIGLAAMFHSGLAGREHLLAWLVGMVFACLQRHAHRSRAAADACHRVTA